METLNILVAGVGGQGIILLSNILSEIALENGLEVKKSEVHGMSQRGGSVVSFVRVGSKVYSPLVPVGKGDIILSMELMETLRWINYLKEGAIALVNDYKLPPPSVAMGLEKYPENVQEMLNKRKAQFFIEDIVKEAVNLGNPRVVNVLLLGMLSKFLTFGMQSYYNAIKKLVKPRFVDVNIRAFDRGVELIKNNLEGG